MSKTNLEHRLQVLENSLSISHLLCDESSGGKHSKTAILQFLGGKNVVFLRIRWLQVQRIKANVTRNVVRSEKTSLTDRDVLGVDPSNLSALLLGSTNANSQQGTEHRRHLGEVGDGRSLDGGIKEEGTSLNSLTNKKTEYGKHSNSAVGDLSLAITLEGARVGFGRESERIKEAHGDECSRVVCDGEGLSRRGLPSWLLRM
jgi:hypothetical protein